MALVMVVVVVMVVALAGVSARVAYFSSLEAGSGQSWCSSRAAAPFRMARSTFCYSGGKWSGIQPKKCPKLEPQHPNFKKAYIYNDFRFGNSERMGGVVSTRCSVFR